MTKRELIDALEACGLPDDAEVIISVGDSSDKVEYVDAIPANGYILIS